MDAARCAGVRFCSARGLSPRGLLAMHTVWSLAAAPIEDTWLNESCSGDIWLGAPC